MLTQQKFEDKANIVHNSKYDYTLSVYDGSHTKIIILCPSHGIFEQKPSKHLSGNGCPKCAKAPKTRLCIVEGCDHMRCSSAKYCSMHYHRTQRTGHIGSPKSSREGKEKGHVNKSGYRVISVDSIKILEHRYVMEQYLGRKLILDENVHHINGDKLNNNIENLELWNVNQPAGQRVIDKVKWAKDIIHLYDPNFIARIKFQQQSRLWFKLRSNK